MLTTAEIATSLRPGMHACTFGGNPIAARAGLAFIETVERENLLGARQAVGRDVSPTPGATPAGVRPGARRPRPRRDDRHGTVDRRRGHGRACLERRLLVNCTHGTVIRLLPAMNLTEEQAHEGCDILAEVLKKQAGNHVPVQ